MTDRELQERYLLCGYYVETAIGALFSRKMIPEELIPQLRKDFYDSLNEEKVRKEMVIRNYKESLRQYFSFIDESNDYVSLTAIAREHSEESPGYVIQSWMRSRNTMEFLKQWEIASNPNFDTAACEELLERAKTTSLTLTPTQWISKTKAVGMYVKQGKGGGVKAHPDIASDFKMWLDPSLRLALVRFMREHTKTVERKKG